MLIKPETEADVANAVHEALASHMPLAIEGGGSKLALGRPMQAARTLSLKAMTGITLYEPAEMVIGAWAGTPVSDVQAALDAKGQMLAFEPPDYRALLGSSGEPTMGGLVATGLAGPRRVIAGGVRDGLIGVRFVNGKGEIIKNGGRVMKNVTGLDLVKLQAGAHGTLGVLTEVIFKVIPKPPQQATLVFRGLSDTKAVAALCEAMGSPFEPTGAAHLPSDGGQTLLRVEGFSEQISYRSAALSKLLAAHGTPTLLQGDAHDAIWRSVRDGTPLAVEVSDMAWRVMLPPTKAAAFVSSLRQHLPFRHYFDWSGGLVWLAMAEKESAGVDLIHAAAKASGGHAMLLRGSEALRASAPVFPKLDDAIMKIQSGLKASFDPQGLLNPGRMYAGV
jgi:glycolate oxidase FAD binding subunit